MGVSHRTCAEDKWNSSLLHLLQEIKPSDDSRLICSAENRLKYRFACLCQNCLEVTRQQRELTSGTPGRALDQDSIQFES